MRSALKAILLRAPFDYYCDSVTGNDSNSGRTSAGPFKTLAALSAVQRPGVRFALARGGSWREKLVLTANSGTIGAYGVGALPIVDCSDVISAGAWTKTGGRTNVYQVDLAVQVDANASEWPAIWVNGTRLTFAADLATCDSTAGTYFCATFADTTPITVFVHSTGDTNPAIDGKTYEAAIRTSGIDTYGVTGWTINDIHGKRNYASYGSIVVGRNCTANRCQVSEGNTHNMLLRANAVANDCTADESYNWTTGPIHFVGFEPVVPSGACLTFNRCTATLTTYDLNTIGFYCHSGDSSKFARTTYNGCISDKLGQPFSGLNTNLVSIVGGSITNFLTGWKTGENTNVSGLSLSSFKPGGQICIYDATGLTYNIDSIVAVANATGTIQATQANSVCNLTNSTITGANVLIRGPAAAASTWYVHGNTFIANGHASGYNLPSASGTVLDSDFNSFGGASGPWVVNTSYATLALYQAGTGQDSHSSA